VATDANTLLSEVKCYACQPPGIWQLLKLGLLRQILLAHDAMADTSVNTLLENVKCYECIPPGMWHLLELALLQAILAAGGGGGGTGGVLCGVVNPVADPGVACAFYYRTDTLELWSWDDGAGTWAQIIA
jgi:hypothetical protein